MREGGRGRGGEGGRCAREKEEGSEIERETERGREKERKRERNMGREREREKTRENLKRSPRLMACDVMRGSGGFSSRLAVTSGRNQLDVPPACIALDCIEFALYYRNTHVT